MTTNSISHNRTLFLEDNLPVLRGLDSDSIDLIATDPPFNKGVPAFKGKTKAGQNVKFKDVWNWIDDVHVDWLNEMSKRHPTLSNVILYANAAAGNDMGAFLCWMAVRVLEMHRVLKDTGSIYLHCDPTASHYLKAMMDAIFGRKNFRNEIVWHYNKWTNTASYFQRNHDTIFWYAKSRQVSFNKQYGEPTRRQIELRRAGYNTGSQGGRKILRVYDREKAADQIRKADEEGRAVYYVDEPLKGAPVPDVWNIPALNGQAKERTGYPTQKPLALYERMIKASSNPGDMVLDPFAGCATTCVVAEQLGRQWIGIDIEEESGDVIRERLEREVSASMAWNDIVRTPTTAPERTDDGEPAAPELFLESPKPKERRISVPEAREALAKRDGLRCQGCGWVPEYLDFMHVDHKKPRKLKGKESLDNFALLCEPCNRKKSYKLTLRELQAARVEEGRMKMDWWESEGKWE